MFHNLFMKDYSCYKIKSAEREFEPGSKDQVLKNLLGINNLHDLEQHESESFFRLTQQALQIFNYTQMITVQSICDYHKTWMGELFSWAGSYRQVNLSKSGFTFAAAHLIPKLMDKFEQEISRKYTPCLFVDRDQAIEALAVTHVEFILIHPFREGNGRIGRLLSTLIAVQAKLPLPDFSLLMGSFKEEYFAAVRSGLDCNYEPMKEIFRTIFQQSA